MTDNNDNLLNKTYHAGTDRLAQTRKRMGNLFTANQVLGRTQTIGCTAVEITQRCNLDCTLCYLSENSESVRDLPIEEVFHRLDEIRDRYGAGVHVQITGGDPTLRKHHELIDIVAYARRIGLYPALFTNGIAASRQLLEQLASAGLVDVAFHVDTTQQRPGYTSEADLNAIRVEYIERARGLGLMIIFNCTVHHGNFAELPELLRFFIAHADDVNFVSLQLQADTGRGVWGQRDVLITPRTVRACVEQAAVRALPWDLVRIGHPECHVYAPALVINGRVYPVIEDQALYNDFLRDFAGVQADRHSGALQLFSAYALALLRRPRWWWRTLHYLLTMIRATGIDLVRARGRVNKLSFFIHNFMDAGRLDQERIDACSFMVMTADGPVSMCAHNARRDDYILKPITITRRDGTVVNYQPLQRRLLHRAEEEAMG